MRSERPAPQIQPHLWPVGLRRASEVGVLPSPPKLRRNPIAELTLHSAGLGFLISAGFFTYNEDYGLIPASQGGAVGIKRVRAHT